MQSASQVGHRAVSISSSSIMASVVFKKDTGIVCLLISGLLLPSVFVSGQPTMTTASTMNTITSTANPTMTMATTASTTNQAASMSSSSSAATPTQSTMPTTYGGTVMSTAIQSPSTNSDSVSQNTHSTPTTSGGPTSVSTHSASSTSGGSSSSSTHSPSTTSGGSASHSTHSDSSTSGGSSSSSTHSPSTTSGGSASHSTHSDSSTSGGSSSSSTHSPSTTSGGSASHTHSASSTSGGSLSSSTHSISTTSEGNMTEENKNATSNSSTEMINCPSFSCYYSDCYSKYNSQNESYCSIGESCQLLKSMGMWYNVSCSASCVEDCNNTSQPNCSVNCCNSTGCIQDIFVPMMMTTTVAATMTTNAPPTTRTTSTTANKGNKCHKGSCTGENCYKNFKDLETCTSTNPHCQLKKETSAYGVVWTAGCTNCTGYAACTGATISPCNLECCTATTTSCLILNGTLNVPSFATRGPYLQTELIASLVCLLAITLLM
ncbi:uncharacterized protein DDB_G0271670 isoform X2 [Poecilia latipinna]|uniref:uncharacterized protein DDB_G0271670 isoform X2 n=1 Tax=Poecilia latipinna TaxID=48699 RepID=UPI00072DE7A4|nr:PREDICTED: uncharacterized protein DDB_G0271670-like isoform X2 [Poecilia latipinna]